MSNSWFRFYSEFAHDPKVQMMGEAYQRRLMMLFCFRCNGDVTLHDDEVTFQLRISPEEWAETKAVFVAKGFIDSDNKILNWDKRQYRSDSSLERVRRHRATLKKPDVTDCNVTVTVQNRTDTEQIQNRTDIDSSLRSESRRARKISVDELSVDHIADWLAEKRAQGRYLAHDEHFVLEQFKQYCKAKGKKYADNIAGYRNAFEWDKCQPRTASGSKSTNKSEQARNAIFAAINESCQ